MTEPFRALSDMIRAHAANAPSKIALIQDTRQLSYGELDKVMDRIAVAAPVGLFLGRLANFVNGELYGRVTDVPWGVIFPQGGALPRHPSQLYEAGLEGLVLGLVLFFLATRTKALSHIGTTSGVFVLGYALSRFTVEFVREPDVQLGFLTLGLTMGQYLCLPMAAAGIWAIVTAKKRSA